MSNDQTQQDCNPEEHEEDEDPPDQIDRILDRINEMKKAGCVFYSADDLPEGRIVKDARASKQPGSYAMFKSKQTFGR